MSPDYDTFPKLFLRNVRKYGQGRTAYREKDMGIWLSKTWEEMYDAVESLSLGLKELGLERGDTVCFIGDNRPEYIWGILAVQSLGGKTVGLFQDVLPPEVEYIVNDADVKMAIVEDQEQTDKLLDIKERVPNLKKIIVDDWKGLRSYPDPLLIKLTEVQNLGRNKKNSSPNLFEKNISLGRGDDIALLSYTSGTTGHPKGVVLSYDNLLSYTDGMENTIHVDENDRVVTYLPLAWIVEIIISFCWFLKYGFVINFPESTETVQENIREVGPSILMAAPRIWEKMCSEVQVKMMDSSWLKRTLYEWSYKKGQKHIDLKMENERLGSFEKLMGKLAYYVMFRTIQDRLGLSHIKHAFTGGAALGPDVFRFFQAFGVKIKQIYGQTECGGIIAIHREGDVDYETVGPPMPCVDVQISDTGEILYKPPCDFLGYYKKEGATGEIKDEEGYLHAADFGYIDKKGHLVVIDRMKDVIKLSDGSNFSPTFIENRLKFSPYIREAIAIGKDRPYVAALIQIDYGFVGDWAEKRQLAYTTFTDLSRKKEVYDLIGKEVKRVNGYLPEAAQIAKFLLLEKELDPDDEELTRSQKLRRDFVAEKYEALINELYEEDEQ
jgi:long-chain acyl-CoA synthetase